MICLCLGVNELLQLSKHLLLNMVRTLYYSYFMVNYLALKGEAS